MTELRYFFLSQQSILRHEHKALGRRRAAEVVKCQSHFSISFLDQAVQVTISFMCAPGLVLTYSLTLVENSL